jgi:hypothetical protein
MARLRIVLRLGSLFDYGARGFNVNTLLPLVEFSKGDANQKFSFLHFPLRGGGVGGGGAKKMQGNFWVCPRESASAVEALSSAIGAYASGSSHHARGACEVRGFAPRKRFAQSV